MKRLRFFVCWSVGMGLFTACQAGYEAGNKDKQYSGSSERAVSFESVSYQGYNPSLKNQTLGEDDFFNPVLPGFFPDPSITQGEDGYYLVNSTFCFFPGIPVFKSQDLVNWSQIGNVIDRPNMLDCTGLDLSRGAFAATIEYEKGVYYVLNTCVDCGGNFLVTARNPEGPWSDPIWLPHVGGIDPSIFFDNGKTYIINNDGPVGTPRYEGHRAIWIREVDPKTYEAISEPVVIIDGGVKPEENPIWIEGPHIYAKSGWYYLSAAEGGTSVDHSQVVLRSRNVMGPYTPNEDNPILTQRDLPADRPHPITSTGHADFVQDEDGNWWAAFLAVQPYEDNYYNTGRETFLLPVDWSGDWPIILNEGIEVPRKLKRPSFTKSDPSPETGKSLDWVETFKAPLGPEWLYIRDVSPSQISVGKGRLTIFPTNTAIEDKHVPSFVGARQQHSHAIMETQLDIKTIDIGVEAGLAVIQNDQYYYALLVERTASDAWNIKLVKHSGDTSLVVETAQIETPSKDGLVDLKIDAKGADYSFWYKPEATDWTQLGESQDGRILSTQMAGGFTGAVFGPYAHKPN